MNAIGSLVSRAANAANCVFGLALLLSALASTAHALPVVAPEVDPGSAASAVTLAVGGLLLLKGRMRR